MLNNIKYKFKAHLFLAICLTATFVSCKKQNGLTEDPYAGGKKPLDITFVTKTIEPDVVNAGEVLSVKVKGLNKYINDFKVYVNEVEAEVVTGSTNDTTLTFKVPITASTGSMWITSQGQSFFGPLVKVGGKVSVDPTWKVINGATNSTGMSTVYDIEGLPNGNYFVGGAFNNFELKGTEKVPIGGIAQITGDGAYTTSGVAFGKAAGGAGKYINSITRIATGSQAGKFIIGGSFTAFNSTRPNRQTLNNVARLNTNGSLDSLVLTNVINPKPQEVYKNGDTVSAFNAGVDGAVRKTFVFGEQVYLVGGFNNYKRIFLPNSSYDEKVYDLTRMRQMVRVNMDGTMDSTFHYNKSTRQSAIGANGVILDAMMQADGKLILVGTFTTFNAVQANRIVRLNLDGSVDNSFSVGGAANGDIYSIRYNANTDKIVIAGTFTSFNGKASAGVNLLNANGSNVATFNPLPITGGIATFVGQLNNGKIIVCGSFNKYGDYLRQGFMVLESNGQLAVGYNNTGGFQGTVYDMLETSISTGSQVILVGDILRFNTFLPRNLLRLTFSN
ncbi:DUF5008 domain-containing protein [Pedobacter psychrodurus]|uniref:DUF5008 domain-containing protein n=1 Tax=Pedobacter psychrodurus TaxID=2530456 RepID=A0A4R0PQR5_9SPHI|nr:DUF5008 domain-containing protein [Pedobacter psychrodurus]TCD20380.1 DUF5008 domain-containing protein [Pedobacter psychrodurus]